MNQKKTIIRPQSIFTESSFSLPTNYYEQTTPYANFHGPEFKKYKIDDGDDFLKFDEDDSQKDINISEDDGDQSRYYDFDDDFGDDFGTAGDYIEAFNPNVQVYILFMKKIL